MLRTLTKKSKMGFGKYAGYTVNDIFIMNRTLYLIWVYYNMSNISFVDSILDELEVSERIFKPGTNKNMFDVHLDRHYSSRGDIYAANKARIEQGDFSGYGAHLRKEKKRKIWAKQKAINSIRNIHTSNSLAANKWRNNGHK